MKNIVKYISGAVIGAYFTLGIINIGLGATVESVIFLALCYLTFRLTVCYMRNESILSLLPRRKRKLKKQKRAVPYL